jgi:hypothetical protein
MDMRKYSGTTFLKVNDVRDGPLQLQIAPSTTESMRSPMPCSRRARC